MTQQSTETTTATSNGHQVLEGGIAGGAPLAVKEKPQAATATSAQPQRARPPVPLVPITLDDVFRTAEALLSASVLPERWTKDGGQALPEKTIRGNLVLAIAKGVEIGMSPIQSLFELYVVKGQVRESALSKLARAQASGLMEKWKVVEETEKRCTIEAKRVGQDIRRHSYSIEDAELAGLVNRKTRSDRPGNWEMRPALMLRRRCMSEILDEEFADVVKGCKSLEDASEEELAEERRRQEMQTTAPTLRRVDTPEPEAARARSRSRAQEPQHAPVGMSPAVEATPQAEVDQPAPPTESPPPAQEPPVAPKPERMGDNAAWDEEARGLITKIRATTDERALNELLPTIKEYKGTWRQDVGRALSDHRNALRGGRGS